MLLRTVVLLLLCVSSGMCATLGHYQAQATEEEVEAHAVNSAALTDGVVAAVAVDAAKGDHVGDSPEAEEPVANTLFGDKVLAEILAVDNPAADKHEVDVRVADGATAEEPGTDSDRPARDIPAMEALAEEAVTQKRLSSEEEEEGNEIRPVETTQSLDKPLANEDNNSWSLNSIRNSFQTMHGYFDSLVELAGGRDGVCQYRCRYGEAPQPRPGYQLPEPNGCSSSLVGFQVNAAMDLGIPAMTECCNQLDVCYDTCGTSKYDCDSNFRSCLHDICSDFKKSLGFGSKVQACESMADALYNTVWTLGCRPYMNSQRAACVCEGEEKDEL
ncbi:group XIIB secretory phospholipase A2-like protein isoform X1 [Seriola lalandi dorsalis]|uniref:group XIIB secretory phospholipase A2-like protein isoform X1 n=1 Tax=Seriola lalandi dorsalis TaxID=1841481 RepID=UPI000C6F7334|nr:group XIIB secretory phospholipase A2-like protein isoform X1 [Seriola lalandi dorsalis]XP_056252348.1 group XIIB secretory phospholipase A2-like protein isoform X1 [Seriola aureovittata]